jgi:hypothetical protein
MTEIDYDALAYASGLTALMRHDFGPETVAHTNIARAVVAALQGQGLVVVLTSDLSTAIGWGENVRDSFADWEPAIDEGVHGRLISARNAALAAPGDGETI